MRKTGQNEKEIAEPTTIILLCYSYDQGYDVLSKGTRTDPTPQSHSAVFSDMGYFKN